MFAKLLPVAAAAAFALPLPAQAQDWVIKAGVTRYDTHAKTTGIQGIGVPPGADATIGDATTAIFVLERTLTPNWSAEVVIGVPPRIKARGAGSVAFLGEVLTAKNVAPTFLVNYNFGQPGDRWRPYLGAGFNYTMFRGVRSPLAPTVGLGDSFGLVAQAGMNYAFSRQMGLYASVARVDVKSDLVAVGSTVLTSSIDFRPWTYSAGVWYRF